jgi:nitrate reductase (NAD(P)H)
VTGIEGEFSVDRLSIPLTLNAFLVHRKEVNMIKKSGGFGWSAAGVSTCLWRGVLVRDILMACNLSDRPAHERWYLQ